MLAAKTRGPLPSHQVKPPRTLFFYSEGRFLVQSPSGEDIFYVLCVALVFIMEETGFLLVQKPSSSA